MQPCNGSKDSKNLKDKLHDDWSSCKSLTSAWSIDQASLVRMQMHFPDSHASSVAKAMWKLEVMLQLKCLQYQQLQQLLVVPQSLVPLVIQSLHNGVGGGHLGLTKALAKIKERPRRSACFASTVNRLVACFASSSEKQKGQRYFKAILLHAEVVYFPNIFPL